MSNLDDAIKATGPKVPFNPVLTPDDVAASLAKQDELIAQIVTTKQRIIKGIDTAQALAPALAVAFPQAAPFIPVFIGASELLQKIIERGNLAEEDIGEAAKLYAQIQELGNTTAPVTPEDKAKALAGHSPHVPVDELPPGHTDSTHHAKPPHDAPHH